MSRRHRSSPFSLFAFQDIITATTGIVILFTLLLSLELLTRQPAAPELVAAHIVDHAEQALEDANRELAALKARLTIGENSLQSLAAHDAETLAEQIESTREKIRRLNEEVQRLQTLEQHAQALEERSLANRFDRQQDQLRLNELNRQLADLQKQRLALQNEDRLIYNATPTSGKVPWLVDLGTGKILVARAAKASVAEHTFEHPSVKRLTEMFLEFAQTIDKRREYFVLLVRPGGLPLYDELRFELEERGYSVGINLISDSHTVIGSQPAGGRP